MIFTHLHVDHIGWATQGGQTMFPNATYRCSAADWEHFMVEHRDEPDNYPGAEGIPVNPHAVLVHATAMFNTYDGSGTILPGIDIMAAPGHTPGSSIVVLSSGTDRAMLLGDVVHCPVQLIEPEWDGLMDVDPAQAKRTRLMLDRELDGKDIPVAAAHFPDLRFGRLLQGRGQAPLRVLNAVRRSVRATCGNRWPTPRSRPPRRRARRGGWRGRPAHCPAPPPTAPPPP